MVASSVRRHLVAGWDPRWIALGIATLPLLATAALASPESDRIARHIAALARPTGLSIEGERITSTGVLPIFYERRDFAPAWSPRAADGLISLIDTAESHGLDPEDYHHAALLRLRTRADASEGRDTRAVADYDVVLSDALLRIAYHAIYGKVDPESLEPSWNVTGPLDPEHPDPARTLQQIIDGGEIEPSIAALAPKGPVYLGLRRALRRYQGIASAGGWAPVPEGPKLERGMSGPRVRALRERLAATRDLTAADPDSEVFDARVERGVKRFQARHRIEADGVVGPATIEAMNVPVEDRVNQIRVNLERARWVLHGRAGRFALVDVADLHAASIAEDERVRVDLSRAVPVILLDRTVEVDEHGEVHFGKDLDDRDAAVLAGLDEGFSIHRRHREPPLR